MEQVLLVVHVMIAAALIGVVLIQRSDTDGFGLGSGSGMNLMTGRSAANLLTRTTAVLATLFIVNSLVLSIMAARHHDVSILDQIEQEDAQTAPLAVKKNKGEATELGIDRDAVVDTDRAAKQKTNKAPSVPTE